MSSMPCGLDFGTSNSTLGVAGGNGAHLVPLEEGALTLPSAVFFSFGSDAVLFGRQAVGEYIAGEEGRLMRALKSVLGTSLAEDTTRVKARAVPFVEIIGLFLGEMKRRAEAQLDEDLSEVVAGRPVFFVDDDPAADRQAQGQLEAAYRAQGFRDIAFQFEPIAAALDYEQQVDREELALIVDIGGGTSDFSLVRVSPERARAADRQGDILATSGVHVGGTDFDRLLSMSAVMPRLGYGTPTADGKRLLPVAPYVELATWHRIHRLYNDKALRDLKSTEKEAKFPDRVADLVEIVRHREGHRLAGVIEGAKIALSDRPETELHFVGDTVDLDVKVTARQLEEAIAGAVARITGAIERILGDAGLRRDGIDTVMVTGGSSQSPSVQRGLHALFPETRFVATDAFGSVGMGLALDAKRKFG